MILNLPDTRVSTCVAYKNYSTCMYLHGDGHVKSTDWEDTYENAPVQYLPSGGLYCAWVLYCSPNKSEVLVAKQIYCTVLYLMMRRNHL